MPFVGFVVVQLICIFNTSLQGVCEVGLEFAAWDSILRVSRVGVRVGVWVRLTHLPVGKHCGGSPGKHR